MSCAADEPGTERGRAAPARGSAGAPGRGRGAQGASALRGWTAGAGAAGKRGSLRAECRGPQARGASCFRRAPAKARLGRSYVPRLLLGGLERRAGAAP